MLEANYVEEGLTVQQNHTQPLARRVYAAQVAREKAPSLLSELDAAVANEEERAQQHLNTVLAGSMPPKRHCQSLQIEQLAEQRRTSEVGLQQAQRDLGQALVAVVSAAKDGALHL